jgi:hypothetical protein
MNKYPAARKGDPITHDKIVSSGVIGPPVTGPCQMGHVIIENKEAAHVGCTVVCTGVIQSGTVHSPPPGPPPPIVTGSKSVLIHKKAAARWFESGDVGECKVLLGLPPLVSQRTVFIGD